MLVKLLRYDLKWIYKTVGIFYLLALILSICTRCLSQIENSVLFSVVAKICLIAASIMMLASLIICFMRLWSRFVNNMYRDESYLTHTLPIKIQTIYLSKVLSAIVTLFTTMIVILICLFICFYSKETLEIVKQSLELAVVTYDTTVIKLILLISFVLFLEVMFLVMTGYLGIIMGHKYGQKKMIKSVIMGIFLYFIAQVITLMLIGIFGLFNNDIMNLINTTKMISIDAIKIIMYYGILLYTIYNLAYYFIGSHLLKKGVNID